MPVAPYTYCEGLWFLRKVERPTVIPFIFAPSQGEK